MLVLIAMTNGFASINRALLKKENILLMYNLHELRSVHVKSSIIQFWICEILTEV